jgi:hypothetical protein
MAAEFDPLSFVMAAHAAIHVLLCLPQKAAEEKKDVDPRLRGDDVESGSDSATIGMSRRAVGLEVPRRTGR